MSIKRIFNDPIHKEIIFDSEIDQKINSNVRPEESQSNSLSNTRETNRNQAQFLLQVPGDLPSGVNNDKDILIAQRASWCQGKNRVDQNKNRNHHDQDK